MLWFDSKFDNIIFNIPLGKGGLFMATLNNNILVVKGKTAEMMRKEFYHPTPDQKRDNEDAYRRAMKLRARIGRSKVVE